MTCLSPETLAALAAGRLSAPERAAAEAHVASCQDCYDVYADVMHMAPAAPVAPHAGIYWGWQRYTAVAAAAVVVLATGWSLWRYWQAPEQQLERAVSQLAEAVGTDRSVDARVNGGFEWGPRPTTTRGDAAASLSFDGQQATLTIRRLATQHPSARALGAAGVASLLAGDVEGAITSLEAAAAFPDADARVLGDLAAAHAERWRHTREAADAVAALDAAERALLHTPADPVARFNHALAVDALGLRDQAIARWRAYLEVDNTSPWADEARERLARLEREPPLAQTSGDEPRVFPASMSGSRRTCAETAYRLLDESRTAFDASALAEAEAKARSASTQLVCAGLPTSDADAQVAWTLFFQNRTAAALDLAGTLGTTSRGLSPLARGQVEYIQALARLRLGRYSEADAGYERAIAAFQQSGDREFEAAATVLRAEVARNRTDKSAAWAGLVPAFDVLPILAPRRRHLTFHNAIASAEWFGLPGAARFFADALVAVNGNSGDPVVEVGAFLKSVQAHMTLRRYDDAQVMLERAAARLASIPDLSVRQQFSTEVDVFTAAVLAQTDPPRALPSYDRIVEAFAPTERPLRRADALLGRGRVHTRLGNAAAAERDWLEGAALFEDPRPELRDEQWRVDSRSELWNLFRELIQVRDADPLGALEVAERFRGRALLDARARGSQATPLTGTALYDWLPADVTVVAYAVLDDGLRRWTVTRDGVVMTRVAVAPDTLAAHVDVFVREVAEGRTGGGVDLARLVLPETLAAARTPRVVFLPDGPLYRVPFAALVQPGSTRLLIDDYIPLMAPSLTILREAAQVRATATRPLLVASGDAHPRERLTALPGVEPEIDALRGAHVSARVLSGRDATARAFLDALPSADLIHFAGHVGADGSTPSRSRLLLSASGDPATVTFADLREITLRPGVMVLLSACDGARGRVFVGEGAVGLPFVFLANGASSVVAALWQVDDNAPASFWVDVHRRLRAGVAPDVALAESQRQHRRDGASSAAWAAFTVVGGLRAS
jgi:tetratricopeptide (TPR) repeat protein